MGGISDDNIRERAYHIWEREGRPHGRDFEHWVRAQVELVAEAGNGRGRPAAAPAAAAKAPASKPAATASVTAKPSSASKPAAKSARSAPRSGRTKRSS